jgi:hypothetical protein
MRRRQRLEEPWKQVKRKSRALVGQPPASRRHADRRKKPSKHKKQEQIEDNL